MLSISLLWIYVDLMYKWTENDNGNDKFWRKPALEPAVAGIYCWLVTNIQESKGIQETLVYFGLTRKVYVCIHSTFFWFHLALIFFFLFYYWCWFTPCRYLMWPVQSPSVHRGQAVKMRKKEKETVVDKSLCSISRSICLQWLLTYTLEMLIQCCWIFCMSRVVEMALYFNTLANKSPKSKTVPYQRPNTTHL